MSTLIQPSGHGYVTIELDIVADEAAIRDVDEWAFGFHATGEHLSQYAFTPEAGRTVGVRHAASGALVAVHSSYAFAMGVPGGEVPTAGLTWVGVHPGHTRHGLGSAMLRTHLRRTLDRGEPVSALFASEPEIYGRFGYGMAARQITPKLPRHVALKDVPGTAELTCTLERLDPDVHREVVLDVQHRSTRPGRIVPSSPALIANQTAEVTLWRGEGELLRIAIVRDAAGTAQAFAIFRRTEKWDEGVAAGRLECRIAVALTGPAAHVLWSTLTRIDLVASVETGILAEDDPLVGQLANVRTTRLIAQDNLWVRIVDLPAALAARQAAAPVDVVVDVTDDLSDSTAGRWRISAPHGTARMRAEPTNDRPDVMLGIAELGAIYLGGTSLGSLAAAGLVQERRTGAVAEMDAAFGWPQRPVCSWIF
jgi:predicted acetyltransferase